MFGDELPDVVARYGGDVMWAVALYWLLAMVWPMIRPWRLGAATFALSAIVEVSQLYHAPWIDAVRANRIGALVLGQGFLWSDFVCYMVGAAVATSIALRAVRTPDTRQPGT